MNFNSEYFKRIRIMAEPEPQSKESPCDHPGCRLSGSFKAPRGRFFEGQYWLFCLEHVQHYNQSYDYFKDMDDTELASYHKNEGIGHRPTWSTKNQPQTNRFHASSSHTRASQARRARAHQEETYSPQKNHSLVADRSLTVLGLDNHADAPTIRARYKELLKRFHPDTNGGDRSLEEQLNRIIHAYAHLRSLGLV